MAEVSTIGLDIAKTVFHAHGADARGQMGFSRPLTRAKLLEFFAAQPRCGRTRGLRRGASLGPGDCLTGSRGEADPASLREAVRKAEQERCGRCRDAAVGSITSRDSGQQAIGSIVQLPPHLGPSRSGLSLTTRAT
jgi:transposase